MKKPILKFALVAFTIFGVAASAAYMVAATTTTTTITEGLRATTYTSISQLTKDSSVVLSGTVSTDVAEVVFDESGKSDPPYTISTVTVKEVLATPGALPIKGNTPKVGDTIRVYQLGKPDSLMGGGNVLGRGDTYVFFLVPTMIPGANAADYFPTGTFSGIYKVSPEDGTLSQKPSEGDKLPATLSDSELRAGLK